MRSPIFFIITSLAFALAVTLVPADSHAQELAAPAFQNGSDVLAEVNALRASYGLPAYNANSILMQIAQAQADYLAATGGSAGHAGPDGSSPKQRALAAGYPATFFSENWISGSGMSPSGAVSWWQGDAEHLGTMLSPSLVDAGAGVSRSGGVVYYVLDAGATGSSAGGGTGTNGTTVPLNTVGPSQFLVPVTVNTPGPDGRVFHEVAYGQSLWSIAIAYGTKIDAIRTLNGLGNTEVYTGQILLVLMGPTPAPTTATPGVTKTLSPATATSTSVATRLSASPSIAPTLAVTLAAAASSPVKRSLNLTAIAIIGAALLFAVLGTWAGTRKPT